MDLVMDILHLPIQNLERKKLNDHTKQRGKVGLITQIVRTELTYINIKILSPMKKNLIWI